MEDRTFTAVVLLGLLMTVCCQPQLSVHDSQEAVPVDKQLAQIGAQIFSLIRPAFSNLGTAFSNAFAAIMAGKKLDLVTIESLPPFKESPAPAPAPAAHSYTPGGAPPKRRPYTRAMALGEDEPLQSGDTTTTSSS